jgi:uncharacterized phage protein (TIGR01671 family)
MMRGFRVWFKRESRWLKDSEFKINANGTISSFGIYTNQEGLIRCDQTGLKDKNGKEVWEGDIVHVERNDSFPSYNQAIIVYEENRGMFMLLYIKPTNPKGILAQVAITSEDRTRMFEQCTGWEIEVIGNEYEHPELTEVGK